MGGHQLEWILGLLDEQADKGTQGMVDSEIWGGKTSSAKAQAGAIEVITHFVKQAESYSYGIGNQAIIDAWISFWRKSSARPATQKD
jgi:hypothetical protein